MRAQLVEVARALADGGVNVVEITMSVPDALDVLRQVRRDEAARRQFVMAPRMSLF